MSYVKNRGIKMNPGNYAWFLMGKMWQLHISFKFGRLGRRSFSYSSVKCLCSCDELFAEDRWVTCWSPIRQSNCYKTLVKCALGRIGQ